MNLNITIDEEKLTELVTERLANDIRHEAFCSGYGLRQWHTIVKEEIKSLMKENKEEITDYAVRYAGEYIGKKGVAKFVEELKK